MRKTITLIPVLLLFSITVFSQNRDFNCGDDLVDSRDGKTYATVQIGDQCWMAENLNYGTMVQSTSAGYPHTNMNDDGAVEKYCYNNNESNCDTYGAFYEWNEMMKYTTIEGVQGVCPNGWHIPSDEEWQTLEMELGMSQADAQSMGDNRGTDEGDKLKQSGSSGFDALFSGFRYGYGSFANQSTEAWFWTSTEFDTDNKYYRKIISSGSQITRASDHHVNGFSVRCVLGDGNAIGSINPNKTYISDPYPNPVTGDKFTVSFNLPPDVPEAKIVVYNILGKEVKSLKVSNTMKSVGIFVVDMEQGNFFYQLVYDSYKSETKRLVISK